MFETGLDQWKNNYSILLQQTMSYYTKIKMTPSAIHI